MNSVFRSAENGAFLALCIVGIFAILSSTMSKNPVLKPFADSLKTPEHLLGFVAAASTIPGTLVVLGSIIGGVPLALIPFTTHFPILLIDFDNAEPWSYCFYPRRLKQHTDHLWFRSPSDDGKVF